MQRGGVSLTYDLMALCKCTRIVSSFPNSEDDQTRAQRTVRPGDVASHRRTDGLPVQLVQGRVPA